jgi:hypothetical protein
MTSVDSYVKQKIGFHCPSKMVRLTMLAKYPRPKSDEAWIPHELSAGDSDEIFFALLPELMDRLDPYVGVGPTWRPRPLHHMLEPHPHE